MIECERYKGYVLSCVKNWNYQFNGFVYIVSVHPMRELDVVLFVEKTQITNTAIYMKYKEFITEKVEIEIINKTINRVKNRIEFGLFEINNEYFQDITSENVIGVNNSISESLIQEYLLKGLLYIRKESYKDFEFQFFNIDGFCEICNINRNEYYYNAKFLKELGFINSIDHNGIEIGNLFITAKGIKYLKENVKTQETDMNIPIKQNINTEKFEYDIALSFAGEDKNIAEEIAKKLRDRNVKVFYSNFEDSNLWGKNIYDYFSEIFKNRSKYCLMLISKYYKIKLWTNLERVSAQSKAFIESKEYILPVKIDDTEIVGIPETIAYVDYRTTSIDEIVELIILKLGKNT